MTKILSALAHELRFEDGSVLPANKELAKVLSANRTEGTLPEQKGYDGEAFVLTWFKPTEKGLEVIMDLIEEHSPEKVLIVGSRIAAQVYGFPVVAPIVTKETMRSPPAEKVCRANAWQVWVVGVARTALDT